MDAQSRGDWNRDTKRSAAANGHCFEGDGDARSGCPATTAACSTMELLLNSSGRAVPPSDGIKRPRSCLEWAGHGTEKRGAQRLLFREAAMFATARRRRPLPRMAPTTAIVLCCLA